ncbi:MAG: hypothetical protein Tp1125DCM238401_41 [Prokaryotic dsDNA virus sp.]|nr:MAG: hypothetical protein Tp1125DCM238401_41 [Prokaryotic dsDNA virus sp.]
MNINRKNRSKPLSYYQSCRAADLADGINPKYATEIPSHLLDDEYEGPEDFGPEPDHQDGTSPG